MQATRVRQVENLRAISPFFTAVLGTYEEMPNPFAYVEPAQVEKYQRRLRRGWAWQKRHAKMVTPATFVRMVLEPQLKPHSINERCGCARCEARGKEVVGAIGEK